jgi:hypothetical protein
MKLFALCLFSLCVCAACGGPTDGLDAQHGSTDASAVGATATTVVFDAQWRETVQGTLVAGATFKVDYDPQRLPQCRASHNGNPGWNITAFARFWPSGTQVQANIMDHLYNESGAPDYTSWVKTTPELRIPEGTTSLELWFNNTSGFDKPCSTWDSDYSKNYRFGVVAAAPEATITFQSDWRNITAGTLARGGALTVSYDTARLVNQLKPFGGPGYVCREALVTLWVHYRFAPGAAFASAVLDNVSERGPFIGVTDYALTIPGDASRVELYFDGDLGWAYWDCNAQNGTGDNGVPPPPPVKYQIVNHYYDSGYGKNYVFAIP